MNRTVLIFLLLGAALYLLYINGYGVTQVKRAVMYVESGKGRKASFTLCTGYTKRIVRFKESGRYHFAFAPELTKGEVEAKILDCEKNEILCLNGAVRSADLDIDGRKRYYLVLRFEGASGRYALDWQ